MLPLIIGIGIVSFILIYIGFTLNKESRLKDQTESVIVIGLRVTLILAGFTFLMFIPKGMTDQICEPVINQTTENTTGAVTTITNTYGTYCYDNQNNTATTFYRIFLYFIRAFWMFFFIFLFVHIVNYYKQE